MCSFCFDSLSRSPSLYPCPVSSYLFLSGGLWLPLPSEIIDRDFKSPDTYPLPQKTEPESVELWSTHTYILNFPRCSHIWEPCFIPSPLLLISACDITTSPCCISPVTELAVVRYFFICHFILSLPSGLWLLDISGDWFHFLFVLPWHCTPPTTLSVPFHFPVHFLLPHWYFHVSAPVLFFCCTIYWHLFLLALFLFPLINVCHMLIPTKLTSLTYLPPLLFHLTG